MATQHKLFHDGETHLPKDFLEMYDTLREWYGMPDIPLKIGVSQHGAHTDMSSIEMGIQLVAACLKENYHGFQGNDLDNIAGAATYFIIAHEMAHNNTHLCSIEPLRFTASATFLDLNFGWARHGRRP